MRERSAVTLEDNERRTQNRVSIFQQLYERVIDRIVGHAMDENVRAFFDRCACRFQFGRVHCDANLVRMTFFNRRAHDWPEAFDRVVFVDDVPNLDQIGFLFGQFPHELACLIRACRF